MGEVGADMVIKDGEWRKRPRVEGFIGLER